MKQAAPNMSAPRLWLRLKPTQPCHMVDSPRVRRIFEACIAVMTAGSSGHDAARIADVEQRVERVQRA